VEVERFPGRPKILMSRTSLNLRAENVDLVLGRREKGIELTRSLVIGVLSFILAGIIPIHP
jgi:hypothetical protein